MMINIDKALIEEKKANHVVKLITNQSYATYQFYALMANRKTSLEDGLRFAALTTIDWIKKRLGEENVPDELKTPSADSYKNDSIELKGYYFNDGYMLNIISLPEEGIWTLQLVEADMSSSPGEEDPVTKAMPGRTFTTNIGYYVNRETGRLECGFQTIVSQPKTFTEKARVYRLAIIRKLLTAEQFGFEDAYKITNKPIQVNNNEAFKAVCDILNSESNQLPIVGFNEEKRIEDINFRVDNGFRIQEEVEEETMVQKLARERFSFGYVCLFKDKYLQELKKEYGNIVNDKEVFLIHPKKFGGEAIAPDTYLISEYLLKYPYYRSRAYSFGKVKFVPEARAILATKNANIQELKDANENLLREIADRDKNIGELQKELSKNGDYETNQELKSKQETTEKENKELKTEIERLENKIKEIIKNQEKKIKEKDEVINRQRTALDKNERLLKERSSGEKLLNRADTKEFYYGEQNDLVYAILKSAEKRVGEGTRAEQLLKKIVSENDKIGFGKDFDDKIKKACRSNDCIKELENLGFILKRENDHYVFTFGNYTFINSKTGSDHRGSDNFASEILSQISINKNY